jgi:DNA-binding transcriptional LysR family regulator
MKCNTPSHAWFRECLLAGVGFELAPAWLIQDLTEAGQLVRLLPRWNAEPQEAFLLYRTRRYQPLRVRVLIQFLAERIPQLPGFSA